MTLTQKEKDRIDHEQWLILQVELHVENLMEEKGINRAQLARKLDQERPQVSQFFDGGNKTLKTIANVLFALDSSLVVDVAPLDFVTTIKPQTLIQSNIGKWSEKTRSEPIDRFSVTEEPKEIKKVLKLAG